MQLVMRFLHCADNSEAVPRGREGYDPLQKIVPVVDLLNGHFAENYE